MTTREGLNATFQGMQITTAHMEGLVQAMDCSSEMRDLLNEYCEKSTLLMLETIKEMERIEPSLKGFQPFEILW